MTEKRRLADHELVGLAYVGLLLLSENMWNRFFKMFHMVD